MAFDLTGLGSLVEVGGKILDRVIPDPAQKSAAQLELAKLAMSGDMAQLTAETQAALAQIDLNKADAQSGVWWQAGWRPFVGWICGAGLGVQFLLAPLLTWACHLCGAKIDFPSLDTALLNSLLMAMLGLGVMRTAEKLKAAS